MAIEHESAALQAKLDHLQVRLENIQGSLFSIGATRAAPATVGIKSSAAVFHPKSAEKKPRARRGELKQRILEALGAAGHAGIRVRDLAVSIGAKQESLHSWFQFARKSIKAIQKAGTGRYRLVDALPAQALAPADAAKSKTAAKPAKAARKSSGKQRGHLSVAVHDALKAAGKDGIRVGDLAKTIGINPRNLFVWFATTGKKFQAIKKVAPGQYRLQS